MSSIKDQYLETVLKEVRFPFDRKQISKELEAHLEESIEFHIEPGTDQEMAEKKAVKDFGDPKEIGKMLNKVHKPLLGWLWLLSKYGLIALTITTVFLSTPRWLESIKDAIETPSPKESTEKVLTALHVVSESTVFDRMVDQRVDLTDATLIIERAILTQEGELILLIQQVDQFNPFGFKSERYPLQQKAKLEINQTEYLFEEGPNRYYKNFMVLTTKSVPVTLTEFTLVFNGFTNRFQITVKGLNP